MIDKRILRILPVAGILALASGCQTGEPFDLSLDEQIPISLSSDINQLAVTRASDNGFASGDQVGVWAVNYEGDTPGTLALKDNQATNVRFTYNGSSWTSDYDIYYKDKNTKVDIYGIYPYTSVISSIDAQPFEVQEDQSTVSAHGSMGGYEASDFLWAKREAVSPSQSTVQLLFQHKMSCVVVTLEEGSGFEDGEFANLSQSVLINNVKRNASINLATGVVTAIGAVPARSTIPAAYEGGFRAIVVPQTVSSACSLFSITLGGTSYTYSQGSAFEYVAGKQHNFNVTVDKKADGGIAVTVQTTISAWTNDNSSHDFVAKEYVVVNVETPGTLGETLTSAGKNPAAIKYLKVLGTVNADDFYYMRNNMAVLQGLNMKETNVVEGKIPDQSFNGMGYLSSFVFPDGNNNTINSIGREAFAGTILTGSLVLPDGLIAIGDGAFDGTRITQVVLPESLQIIGNYSFSSCSLLGNLVLPTDLVSIGNYAFYDCGLSGNLILPDSLTSLGDGAFSSCGSLTGELRIPLFIEQIGGYTFNECEGLSRLVLHDGIKSIGENAFYYCRNLRGELTLPSTLLRIGPYAFANCGFSGSLYLPESLQTIGWNAFEGCSRLSGTLSIPSSLSYINGNTFSGCAQLEKLLLPGTMQVIESGAFNGCYGLKSIVSDAINPPSLLGDVFSGVPKDNFAIEVPEESVNDYSLSSGWNDFRRFTAYQDFTLSRSLLKTLNSSEEHTIVLTVENGSSWFIESKPDWVTVSPSSGIGKAGVSVTVSDLTSGLGNRTGEIVFSLDGKDYRSSLTIEQYDYAYGDGSVITKQTHSKGNGIPLVFMGDCYDAADIASGSYLADTEEAFGYFFDIEPYKSYQDYFDVYIVFGKSEDSGVGSVNTIRESKFETQYSLTGGQLENSRTKTFEYALLADQNMDIAKGLVVMVLNNSDYAGVTHMYYQYNEDEDSFVDGGAIAICPKSSDPYPYDFRGIVQHEAGGHGFGKLADEYIYHNAFITAEYMNGFLLYKRFGWYKNLSATGDRDTVPWSHLIYNPAYSNVVDIYEGGYFFTRGIFRSESNSCMNNCIPYYSAISRQAIVERIMDYAGVPFDLEGFYANDVRTVTTKASVDASPSWMPTSTGSSVYKHNPPVIVRLPDI